jgi:putative spermidine/putrescine transport system substrate-binding protein
MLNRRSLLTGAGALTLSHFLSACAGGSPATLRVQLLADSIPAQLLQEFEQRQQSRLSLSAVAQLADLYALLQTWQQPSEPSRSPLSLTNRRTPAVANLVTLGDVWLAPAIQQGLVQPLNLLSDWQPLPEAWQTVVRRDRQGNLDPQGERWAAPYRIGTLMIAYRRDQFEALGWTPQDWQDLWRSELRGKLSLLDSPRAVIGLALKRLGQSFNSADLDAVSDLSSTLQALHQQVKFYSSDAYLQPLLLKHTWVAVGWSTDILPMVERDRRIAAVVPTAGTILTADLWVRPASADLSDSLAARWIEFCWQPEIATRLSVLSSAVSPVVLSGDRAKLPKILKNNALRLPPTAVLDRSEFLLPLPAATVEQYRRVWLSLRQAA